MIRWARVSWSVAPLPLRLSHYALRRDGQFIMSDRCAFWIRVYTKMRCLARVRMQLHLANTSAFSADQVLLLHEVVCCWPRESPIFSYIISSRMSHANEQQQLRSRVKTAASRPASFALLIGIGRSSASFIMSRVAALSSALSPAMMMIMQLPLLMNRPPSLEMRLYIELALVFLPNQCHVTHELEKLVKGHLGGRARKQSNSSG